MNIIDVLFALKKGTLMARTDTGMEWQIRKIKLDAGKLYIQTIFMSLERFEPAEMFGITEESFFVRGN